MTYKAVNPQFYSHLSLPVDPVSPPSKVHTTNGSYLTTFIACPPSSYVLLVEALGTAPKSSSAFNSYHQTVPYLYHAGGYLSIPFSNFFQRISYIPKCSIKFFNISPIYCYHSHFFMQRFKIY